jgi:nitrite reductase/ring-hydroxylating ferredoxin subunit
MSTQTGNDVQFIRICDIKDVSAEKGKSFRIGKLFLAVFHSDGKFFATSDICTHEHELLSEGWLEGTHMEYLPRVDKYPPLPPSGEACGFHAPDDPVGWLVGPTVECPRHGATFDLRTGEAKTLPASEPIEVFAIEIKGSDVMVGIPVQYLDTAGSH